MTDPAADHLPDWDAFERDYVASGVPHAYVVRPDPEIEVFVDPGASRMGVRFRVPAGAPAAATLPMQEIRAADVAVDGRRYLEITSQSRDLYPNFFRLIADVVVAVLDGASATNALADAVARWDALLQRPVIMSDEAQAGLYGELWFLRRLLSVTPSDAVAAWTGPAVQVHDFRIGADEFEVKTTVAEHRTHTINGLGQLSPSPGFRLFLVSLQIVDAGSGGETLPEAIAAAEASVPQSDRAGFRTKLAGLGYRDQDATLYPRRRKLRTPAMIAPVIEGFPRLTQSALDGLDAAFAADRIRRIEYSVNLDGLGVLDGTPAFLAVVPAAPEKPI